MIARINVKKHPSGPCASAVYPIQTQCDPNIVAVSMAALSFAKDLGCHVVLDAVEDPRYVRGEMTDGAVVGSLMVSSMDKADDIEVWVRNRMWEARA